MSEFLALRRKTRQLKIGDIKIGGDAPISIQSMANTKTSDIASTLAQIESLKAAGCDIMRLAIADMDDALALKQICKAKIMPLVADIHFDYRLALAAIEGGIDALRLNPGNITNPAKVAEIVAAAKAKGLPIRIGVNGGSLPNDLIEKYGGITAKGLVEAAGRHIEILEDKGFFDIKISLKASHLPLMVAAYRQMAKLCDYPLHIGVTEAGLPGKGSIKSALGIGILLAEGIGDTLRVSLTGNPLPEVVLAKDILAMLELKEGGSEIIACPTCGRTAIDVAKMAAQAEQRLAKLDLAKPLKVAVMGCAVNGPGEAKAADIGIAGGKGRGLLFVKGEVIGHYPEAELLDALFKQIKILNSND